MASTPKVPVTVYAYFVLSWLIGWWLVYDGLHQRLFGDYVRIDGQLGPWATLVSGLGLDPQRFSWFFIMLGSLFLATSFGVYFQQRWAYNFGLGASAIGLLYLGLGTAVALACLVVLWLKPTRVYINTSNPETPPIK